VKFGVVWYNKSYVLSSLIRKNIGDLLLKEKIIQCANKIGIDLISFTDGRIFSEVKQVLEERIGKGYLSPFLQLDVDKNTNPVHVWVETKSIISIGLTYHSKLPSIKSDYSSGDISRVAWGKDYHGVLMDKMDGLMGHIKIEYPQLEYKAFVDNAPLLDRAIAHRSGLGFYGKNGFIIHPIYGSYIFLGHILVNIELAKSTQSYASSCGNCVKCIQACPTGALEEGYGFNSNKCISYFTQKKELLHRWERKAMGKNLYGCDICQEVCPINKKAKITKEMEFIPTIDVIRPKILDIVNMDNTTFKKRYGPTAAGWRGKKNLQKNAIIVAGNIKSIENYQLLRQTVLDSRWEISLYSMFSLLEYGETGINLVDEMIKDKEEEFVEKFLLFRN